MIYCFDGEFIEEEKRIFIKIPFNVWDKCGRKGNIPVKVTIDDLNYECKLIPKGNGIYYIPITKTDLRKVDANNKFKITFELIPGLSRINKDSPYNLERPIRKIDSISIVNQPKKGLCGQACIAMITGISLEKVINLMGSQCSLSKTIEALDYYGISHADKMVYDLKQCNELPECCIINTKGHLMIYFEGKYYDPSIGIMEEFDSKEITGILEIFL